MPSALPATLATYRRLSALAAPFAAPLIARRLKRGKEDPERLGERRGIASVERPAGPLIWIHGASVGEVLAALKRLGLDRDTLVMFSSDNGPWYEGSPGPLRGR